MLSFSRARVRVRIMYEKTYGQIPLKPSLGKQNVQVKMSIWSKE